MAEYKVHKVSLNEGVETASHVIPHSSRGLVPYKSLIAGALASLPWKVCSFLLYSLVGCNANTFLA
jgi:hypothetical protein